MTFRQTEALAFLKPQEVAEGLAAVRNSAPREMERFFYYFEKKKTYVGRIIAHADGTER